MNKNSMRKMLSFILCIVLIAAMALFVTGCSDKKGDDTQETPKPSESTPQVITKGEGATQFTFIVEDLDGTKTQFLVKTDKTIVGEALEEAGLITCEEGPYGRYVKAVNGVVADFNTDGTYWAFYVNGDYATKGVDSTKIDTAVTYSFVRTKS